MALGPRKRKPRKKQFNLTLSEEHTNLLRTEAGRLKLKATTLAGQLLGQALTERASPRDDGHEVLEALRAEVRALARSHHNATLKLLRTAGGMSVADVSAWAKRHLER